MFECTNNHYLDNYRLILGYKHCDLDIYTLIQICKRSDYKIFTSEVNKVTEIDSEVRVCVYMETFLVRQDTRSKTRLSCVEIAN